MVPNTGVMTGLNDCRVFYETCKDLKKFSIVNERSSCNDYFEFIPIVKKLQMGVGGEEGNHKWKGVKVTINMKVGRGRK